MSIEHRVYIKAIIRKTKKAMEDKITPILNEDNYGLTDFEMTSQEFESLSEEFSGKCILEFNDLSEDEYICQKKNKEGENLFSSQNQYIQQEKVLSSNIKKQQSQEVELCYKHSETITGQNQRDDIKEDILIYCQQGEINHLEDLSNFQKTVGSKQKTSQSSKKQKISKMKQGLQNIILKIQSKKILKIIRIA